MGTYFKYTRPFKTIYTALLPIWFQAADSGNPHPIGHCAETYFFFFSASPVIGTKRTGKIVWVSIPSGVRVKTLSS